MTEQEARENAEFEHAINETVRETKATQRKTVELSEHLGTYETAQKSVTQWLEETRINVDKIHDPSQLEEILAETAQKFATASYWWNKYATDHQIAEGTLGRLIDKKVANKIAAHRQANTRVPGRESLVRTAKNELENYVKMIEDLEIQKDFWERTKWGIKGIKDIIDTRVMLFGVENKINQGR